MKKIFFLLALCGLLVPAFAQLVDNAIRVSYDKSRHMLVPDRQGYAVISYDLSLVPKNSNDLIGPYLVTAGHRYTPDVEKCMQRMKPGDKVICDNIKVKELSTNKVLKANQCTVVID